MFSAVFLAAFPGGAAAFNLSFIIESHQPSKEPNVEPKLSAGKLVLDGGLADGDGVAMFD